MKRMKKCLVSIIIPVYRVEKKLLKRCLDSVINQSYKNMDILIISDGANNEIVDYIEQYQKKYTFLRFLKKNNEGVSIARNLGISMAKGDYIMFVDCDDWLEPNCLEKFTSIDNLYDFDIIVSNYKIGKIDYSFCIDHLTKNELVMNLIAAKGLPNKSPVNYGVPWAKLYKKELISNNKIKFPEGMVRYQDNIFNLYAFYNSKKEYIIKDSTYNYCINNKSISHTKNTQVVANSSERFIKETRKFIDSYLEHNQYHVQYKKRFNYKIFKLELHYLNILFSNDKMYLSNREIKKILINKFEKYLYKISYINEIEIKQLLFFFCLKYKVILVLRIMIYIRKQIN